MMQSQFGKLTIPVSSIQLGEEIDRRIAAEKEALNRSRNKLQQACKKKVTTAILVATLIQSEADKWMAKVRGWFEQGMKSAQIPSQTDSQDVQMQKWADKVKQAVKRTKDQEQEVDFISLAIMKSPTGVEYLVDYLEGAMVGVNKILQVVRQIDDFQAEAVQKDISTTDRVLQLAAKKLKKAYLKQTRIAAEIQQEMQARAEEWMTHFLELSEQTEAVDRLQRKVQEWQYEELADKMETQQKETQNLVDVWTSSDELKKSYYATDIMVIAREARKIIQYTVGTITETEEIFTQIVIVAMEVAPVTVLAEEAAHEVKTAEITGEMEVKEVKVIEARAEADRKVEEAMEIVKLKEEVKAVKEALEAEKEAREVAEAKTKAIEEAREVAHITNSDSINVINTAIQHVMATIPVERHPMEEYPLYVIFSPNRGWAHVINVDSISPFETITVRQVMNITPMGKYPLHIVISPNRSRAYVMNWENNDVSVIDIAT
jgi:YVTN family beta-propeller protein